jgi:hypothetical protein
MTGWDADTIMLSVLALVAILWVAGWLMSQRRRIGIAIKDRSSTSETSATGRRPPPAFVTREEVGSSAPIRHDASPSPWRRVRPVGERPPPAFVTREDVRPSGPRQGSATPDPDFGEHASVHTGTSTSDPITNIKNWQNHSPLALLGYRVGKTKRLKVDRRREILRQALNDYLPNAYSREYAERWGTPGTRARYNRICQHLALMIEMHKARSSRRYAVSDWTTDLSWFKENFSSRFS